MSFQVHSNDVQLRAVRRVVETLPPSQQRLVMTAKNEIDLIVALYGDVGELALAQASLELATQAQQPL